MRDLVHPGGWFYWSIVRDQDDKVFNLFTFPRIVWTKEELAEAERKAEEYRTVLGLDS